ncbi:MAG: SRPBCC family protein, partial [Candidatus Komeilibacteria bacterium]
MKKMQLKGSWIIKAPREKVYKIMSDFENMPRYFPDVAESLRIVKREGNNLTIEAKAKSFGRVILTKMQTQLRPPIGYVSDNKSAIGTAGHEEFLLEEVLEGTKIYYTYDLEINNVFLRIFG